MSCEIRGSGWHITIKVWKIYNGKTEVVVIMSGKKLSPRYINFFNNMTK